MYVHILVIGDDMSSMDVRITTPAEGLMEMTAAIGPLFLMDYFFNEKKGKPYSLDVIGSDGSNTYHLDKDSYSFSQTPLRAFGSPVVEVYMCAHIKADTFRRGSNMLVPAMGTDVNINNFVWLRIMAAESDYSENDETIRFRIEAWSCDYHLDGEHASLGWVFESKMVKPIYWMTFNKITHEITVS